MSKEKYWCKKCRNTHTKESKIGKAHQEFSSWFKFNPFEKELKK